ncbi:adhesive plaque matrix protein-like [Platichthys flesus]|uniref:adhesive plaque matrix protein-like n=1 Tax=Platichthys flesus TaxID=8260 RepID=UPI002DBB27C7|nr:adhesive plaque matrix protein-like [Platichthys flesus]
MLEGKRKGAAVYWAVGFIVACYLAQTANCHQPKETGKPRGPTIRVRDGTIVFGRGVESHVANGNRKAPANASAVEDERAYQADSAGLSNGHAQDTSPREASWKRMAPSLQCSGDQMKFRAVGPGASKFAVDQGNAPPMPLSQVPSNCGYTMQRNSLALVMLVPYDGCNIVQQGGSYMLPMRWQGVPLSLWCDIPAEQLPATTTPPATTSAQPQDPEPMSKFPVYPPYYHWYPPGPLPTPAEPTTTPQKMTTKPTTTQSQVPQFPRFPPYGPQMPQFPPYGHYQQFPHYHWPLPTPAEPIITTPEMTTEPTTTQSQVPHFPQLPYLPPYGHQMPYLPPYGPQMPQFPPYGPFQKLPLPTPAEPIITTPEMTTEPTTTQSQVPQVPHFPQLPKFPPYGHQMLYLPPYGPQMPQLPPYGPFQKLPLPTPAEPIITTPEMTTKPTTTQSQVLQVPHFPQLPKFPPYGPQMPYLPPYGPQMPQFPPYGPFQKLPLPTPAEPIITTPEMTTEPTTTQSQVPQVPHSPQLPKFPHFPPYGPQMPHFPPYGPAILQIPYGHFPPHPFYQFIPPSAPKYPTSKPETTTLTPAPTTKTTTTKEKTEDVLTPAAQNPSNVKPHFPVLQFPFMYAPPPGYNKMV